METFLIVKKLVGVTMLLIGMLCAFVCIAVAFLTKEKREEKTSLFWCFLFVVMAFAGYCILS